MTGAGDAFAGALAVAILSGQTIDDRPELEAFLARVRSNEVLQA